MKAFARLKWMISVALALALAVLLLLTALALTPAWADPDTPTEVCVDDDFTGASEGEVLNGSVCGMGDVVFGYDAFATVNDGVNGVADGGIVHVADGTYQEAVLIDGKSLQLVGQSLYAVIQAPDSVPVCTTTSYDWHALLCVLNHANVIIDTLTVDGMGKGGDNYRFIGVGFRNAGGALQNSAVINIKDTPLDGTQHGVGLVVYEDDGDSYAFTVANNHFTSFQKNAMALYTEGSDTSLDTVIEGNTIQGIKGTDQISQNGIQVYQVGGYLHAEIMENAVDGIAFDNTESDTKWVATSILNAFADADIHDNVITGAHEGIYVWDGAGTITNNDLSIEKIGVFAYGITVNDPPDVLPQPYLEEGTALELRGSGAPSTVNLAVEGNTLTFSGDDNADTFGLAVYAGYGDNDLAFTASHNDITGFDYGVYFYQCNPDAGDSCGAGTVAQAEMHENHIMDNTRYGAFAELLSAEVDATNNWWGSGSGPYNATSNPNGLGNPVDGTILFNPWCTNMYCTPYIPSLGDFDGDGRLDLAVFRGEDGSWHIYGMSAVVYGQTSDVPVPGDYNGDGKAEIAVYRPDNPDYDDNSTWHVYGYMGPFVYGQPGDIPVPADYDGDGAVDIAVFRPGTGTWYIYGMGHFDFGADGDIPVPADYNGDGKAEIAVFHPEDGTWHIMGSDPVVYGTGGDIPVPGDYNGDGKAEIAVFRPGTGTWYIQGMGAYVYGAEGDIPAFPTFVPGLTP